MSKARRVSKILDGELKTDAIGLTNPTRESKADVPAGLESQKDANVYLHERVEALETPEGMPEHDHDYADSDHTHPKQDFDHEHDADYADKRHRHDSDYAPEGHSHDQKYEQLHHATSEHDRLDAKIDNHAGTQHAFLPLAGGQMGPSAKIDWPSNTGIVDGLQAATKDQMPVRKKEFDEAVLGVDGNLQKIEANTEAIEKEVQDRKDADAGKADVGHTHEADTAPHTHDEYQAKGDYAAGTHTHPPQDLTHDHDGTYAPVHNHPYAADDHSHPPQDLTHDHDADYAPTGHDHDAAYKHEHPYAADDHTHDTTHSHDDYFLKGSGVDDNGDPLPLPYNDAFTLGEAVNEVKDENAEQNDRLDDLEAHGHTDYISAVQDTLIKPTEENPFITINTKVPKKEDGSFVDGDFGLEIDLDEGNTWHNQFNVGTERNGYALKVLGGTGRNVWFGGEVSQKGGGIRENKQADNFIVRKNLTDATEPLWEAVDQTKDDVEALEAEMELLAKTLESGTWTVTDSAVRPGQVNLTSNDFSAADNIVTIHDEDNNGKTHGWTTLVAGEYIELTADHTARNLADADYALYEVTSVMDGGDFVSVTVKLYQGHGDAVDGESFRIKVIDLAGTDLAELDERYATKSHTHSSVPSHSHNYAAASHTHSGLGGSVVRKHGVKTYIDFDHGHYGDNKVFVRYRATNTGSLYEATSAIQVKDTGEVKLVGNGSGLAAGYGTRGVLIGSTTSDHTWTPYLMLDVFETEDYVQYGYHRHIFKGVTTWLRGSATGTNWSNAPALYWTWVGEDK